MITFNSKTKLACSFFEKMHKPFHPLLQDKKAIYKVGNADEKSSEDRKKEKKCKEERREERRNTKGGHMQRKERTKEAHLSVRGTKIEKGREDRKGEERESVPMFHFPWYPLVFNSIT